MNKFDRYGGAYSANSLAFLPDGTLLTTAPIGVSPDPKYTTLEIFSLIQWNAETGRAVQYIPELGYPPKNVSDRIGPADNFVVSTDGSRVAGISKGDVLLFETRGWSIIRRFATPSTPKHRDRAQSVAISPSGLQVAVGTLSGDVHFFDLTNGAIRLSFHAYATDAGFGCSNLAFSPNGRFLVTGKGGVSIGEVDDGWTRIWRVDDGTLIARLTGGEGSVRTAAWNLNGGKLAVGDDRTLRLWQTSQLPQQPRLLKKARDNSFSAAFSPSGVLAVSDGSDVVIYT